ncbi:hypothetical protein CLOM_g1367 [Closterium sp. NIES-68]|nr:hypothetical protein CLOM_g1367 [Closterium sp. NIES-68]
MARLSAPIRRSPVSPLSSLPVLLLVAAAMAAPPPPAPSSMDQILPVPGASTPDPVAMAEKAALLAFASALGDHPVFARASWINKTLGMSYENTKPCVQFWQRITCDEKGRVNAIDFNIAAMMSSDPEFAPGGSVGPLKGRVPWERMGALGNLVLINLQGNAIHGPPLPANLTAFPKLYEILLQGNRFNGSLPDQISTLKALKKL